MSLGGRFGLPLALLAGTVAVLGNVEIHVCKLGDAPDLIELHFADKSPSLRLEAADGFIMKAHAIPEHPMVNLYGVPTEASSGPADLGKVALPRAGRHILLISQTDSDKPLIKLLPFDRNAHPPGGVRFLNLTSLKIRCYLNANSVEIAAGEDKLHQIVDPSRRIVNHRLQSWQKKEWKTENATTLILGANNRFLLVFSQSKPNSEIRSKLITDFDPEGNLAPLVKPEPPVTATPPPDDQPAK
jgi:hypothetical protein